jgi:hypothetical protein
LVDVCSDLALGQVTMHSPNIGVLLNAKGVTRGSFMGAFDLTIMNADGSTGCKINDHEWGIRWRPPTTAFDVHFGVDHGRASGSDRFVLTTILSYAFPIAMRRAKANTVRHRH